MEHLRSRQWGGAAGSSWRLTHTLYALSSTDTEGHDPERSLQGRRAVALQHGVRQPERHVRRQMTETQYYGLYIDNILIVMSSNDRKFEVRWLSAQVDQLLQLGNLQPAPSASMTWAEFGDRITLTGLPSLLIYVLWTPWSTWHRWATPTLVSLWTTRLCGCPRLRQSTSTLHHWYLDLIGVLDCAPEEAQGSLHTVRRSGASRTRQAGTPGLSSEDETNSQRLTGQNKLSRAVEKSSQGLKRQNAFKGQLVVACTPAEVNTSVPSESHFRF